MPKDLNTKKKIIQSSPLVIFVRWINFLGLFIVLLLGLPSSMNKIFALELTISTGHFMLLGFYIFIGFSLWMYILFLIIEINNSKKNNMKFGDYISSNLLIYSGFFLPFIVFMNLLLT